MVLSNKKLKQRLRSLLTEDLTAAESGGGAAGADPSPEVLNLKETLTAKRSQRPRPPRKRKREDKKEEGADGDGENDNREGGEAGGDGGGEKVKGECEDGSKKSKNKRKNKKKKEKGECEEGSKKSKNKRKNKKKKEKEKEKKKKEKVKVNEVGKEESCQNGTEEEDCGGAVGGVDTAAYPTMIDEIKEIGDAVKKVYVGGIPYYSTEDDIRSFFDSCGTITELDCMRFPETGKFRGIAILTFKTEAAAKRALNLDGADMGGLYLKVQPYKSTRPAHSSEKSDFAPEIVDGYNRIYAGNLSWDITEDELKQFFSDCNITSIRFGEDKATGDFKGYAHVDFSDSVSLAIALKLDQKEVCGRPVRIRCAVPLKKNELLPVNGKCNAAFKDSHGKASVKKDNSTNAALKKNNDSKTLLNNNNNNNSDIVSRDVNKDNIAPGNEVDAVMNDVDGTTSVSKSENGTNSSNAKKKKRQTCYLCGIAGHISSSCPQKASADAVNSGGGADALLKKNNNSGTAPKMDIKFSKFPEVDNEGDTVMNEKSVHALASNIENYTVSSTTKKKKRQTCYVCGVPGHISSSCPQKKTDGVANS